VEKKSPTQIRLESKMMLLVVVAIKMVPRYCDTPLFYVQENFVILLEL